MTYLSLTADMLMIVAATGAAIYCLILSRRLSRLTSFDKGIGGAIAVLSAQVDEMKAALAETRTGSDAAGQHLRELIGQAREISGELELMIAACHDFAETAMTVQAAPSDPAPPATPTVAPMPEAIIPDPAAPSDAAPPAPAAPIFGSRRAAAAQPVFLRHGQV